MVFRYSASVWCILKHFSTFHTIFNIWENDRLTGVKMVQIECIRRIRFGPLGF